MGSPLQLVLALAVALASSSCRSEGDAAPPTHAADVHELAIETPRELVTRDGLYVVTWVPVDGAVPVNDHFEVDVTVARNDDARTPVEGAAVAMTCYMPDHGHGMLREPKSEELGGGRYRVRGFLLHMGGYWTVSVSAVVDGVASTADDELNL